MVDNLKSAVLTRLVGAAPVFNPKCLFTNKLIILFVNRP